MLPQSGQEGSSFTELSLNQRIRVEKARRRGKAAGRVRDGGVKGSRALARRRRGKGAQGKGASRCARRGTGRRRGGAGVRFSTGDSLRRSRSAHAVARARGIDIIGGNKFPERIAHDPRLHVFPTRRCRHRRRVLPFAEGLHRPVRLLRQAKREPLHGLGALHCVTTDGRCGIRNRGAYRPAARVLLVQPLRRGESQGHRRALRGLPAPSVHAARGGARGKRTRAHAAGEQPLPCVSGPHRAFRAPGGGRPASRARGSAVRAGARLARAVAGGSGCRAFGHSLRARWQGGALAQTEASRRAPVLLEGPAGQLDRWRCARHGGALPLRRRVLLRLHARAARSQARPAA